MPLRFYLLGLLIAITWGSSMVAAKIASGYLPPFTLGVCRFAMVGLCLIPFAHRMQTPLWKALLLAQIWGAAYSTTYLFGLSLGIDAAAASLVIQLALPFSVMFGIVFFREHISLLLMLGVALALFGVYILQETPNILAHRGAFYLITTAAFLWAIASVVLQHQKEEHFFGLVAWMSLFSVPTLLLFVFLSAYIPFIPNEFDALEQMFTLNQQFLLSWVYLCLIGPLIVDVSWVYLLAHFRASQVMVWVLPIPIFGITTALIILKEQLTASMVIGGIIILLGMALILFEHHPFRKKIPQKEPKKEQVI